MQDYFGECSEATIKDNVVIVYELLEEMLDNGFPLATESNILKELIKPPTILRSMVNSITGRLIITKNVFFVTMSVFLLTYPYSNRQFFQTSLFVYVIAV